MRKSEDSQKILSVELSKTKQMLEEQIEKNKQERTKSIATMKLNPNAEGELRDAEERAEKGEKSLGT